MPRSSILDALVLRTMDVGEADRFCILFSREQGKFAARARGVRKLGSRMGGSLLPLNHVQVEVRESSAGNLITGVKILETTSGQWNIDAYIEACQGIETVIALLHDGEPMEEVFDVTLDFLRRCRAGQLHLTPPFGVRLLMHLGLLPVDAKDPYFARLNEEERIIIHVCSQGHWPEHAAENIQALKILLRGLIETQADKPLKAAEVAARL